ncbi:flippase [Patescibacteria group bacterium]|nr:flippase [Patescibacteria group bacterium]
MELTQKVAKNTSYYTVALVIQKIISFGYFSYLAVQIGAENLGKYTFALFFTTMFAVLIDLGLANVITREVAKFQEKAGQYLTAVLAVKVPLSIITYLIVVGLINLMGNPEITRQLVYITGIIMVIDSFTLTFYAIFRGFHNLKIESIGTIIFQVLVAGAGIILVQQTHDVRILILALLLGSAFNLFYSMILLIKKLKIRLTLKADKGLLKSMMIITIPFALAGIFTRVYGYIDSVFLHQFISDEAVGYYSIPYKITFALQFIPLAFIAALYPAFSTFFVQSKEMLKMTFQKSIIYLAIIAVPITLGIISIADKVMVGVYSDEYLPSIIPLQILIASLPFLFINFPLGALLNACNRQIRNTVNIGIVMVINVILNLILIPKYSVIGAAAASTISTFIMFILQIYVAKQITPLDVWYLVRQFLKILLAGAVMYGIIVLLKPSLYYLFLIPVGAAVFFGVLFITRGFTIREFKDLLKSISQKNV